MAFDTSGFNLTVPQAPIVTPSLANLAPVSINAPALAWKPADIKTPSTAVSEGIALGLGAIGKGITAAYQNTQAEKKAKADAEYRQQELQLKQQELAANKSAKLQTLGMEQAKLGLEAERIKNQKDYQKGLLDRASSLPLKYRTVDFGSSTEGLNDSQKSYLQSLSTGESSDQTPLPGEDPLLSPDTNGIELDNSPLGSLTAPVPAFPTTPSLKPEELSQMMAQIPTSDLSASTSSLPPMADLKAPIDFSNPNAAKNALGNLSFDKITASLTPTRGAKLDAALASTSPVTEAAPSHPLKHAFKTEEEAWREATRDIPGWQQGDVEKVDGIDPTTGKPTIGYVAKRKQVDPRLAATEAYRKTTEGLRKEQMGIRQQNVLNNERSQFYATPQIKLFLGPNGMQQSFARFMADYDKVTPGSPGAGISQIGLLDMFARAEAGGRVTQAQADLALQARTIKEKWETLFNTKFGGGDVLSKDQMDQMRNVMQEDFVKQAKFANQAVAGHRSVLEDQGVSTLPTDFILPISREEGENTVDWYKTEIPKLKAQYQEAKDKGDKQTADQIEAQLSQYGSAALELRKKIDKSKSSIINLDDMEDIPQGWFGSAAKKNKQ